MLTLHSDGFDVLKIDLGKSNPNKFRVAYFARVSEALKYAADKQLVNVENDNPYAYHVVPVSIECKPPDDDTITATVTKMVEKRERVKAIIGTLLLTGVCDGRVQYVKLTNGYDDASERVEKYHAEQGSAVGWLWQLWDAGGEVTEQLMARLNMVQKDDQVVYVRMDQVSSTDPSAIEEFKDVPF